MNVLYPKWKEALLQASANCALTGTVNAYLIDTTLYTYSGGHQFLTDVAVGARVSSPQTLATKTFINGVFDAADLLYPTVAGAVVSALILAVYTGVDATSRLVYFMDDAVNLPFTPSGLDQPVTFNGLGIFGL